MKNRSARSAIYVGTTPDGYPQIVPRPNVTAARYYAEAACKISQLTSTGARLIRVRVHGYSPGARRHKKLK